MADQSVDDIGSSDTASRANAHAQASVRGLIEDDGRYLVLKHDMPSGPIWGVPGGRATVGENPRAAVAREVFEETRLEVDVGDPLEAFSYTWAGGEKGVVSVIFECTCVGGDLDIEANTDSSEPITAARWLEPDAVDDVPMEGALRRLIRNR
ncbi:NUDIX domain-containing protein [Natronosalvus vescus]|uniref:NUDIX domain-containing protein n=1 Tax=Natronosalvus vescus TaxID=2953881 RepID=UPI002091E3C9|nr:NUDIX hydrolase [Natronosalvus vescus]